MWEKSSRIGLVGIGRFARCEGSPQCISQACPYLKDGYVNRIHFLGR